MRATQNHDAPRSTCLCTAGPAPHALALAHRLCYSTSPSACTASAAPPPQNPPRRLLRPRQIIPLAALSRQIIPLIASSRSEVERMRSSAHRTSGPGASIVAKAAAHHDNASTPPGVSRVASLGRGPARATSCGAGVAGRARDGTKGRHEETARRGSMKEQVRGSAQGRAGLRARTCCTRPARPDAASCSARPSNTESKWRSTDTALARRAAACGAQSWWRRQQLLLLLSIRWRWWWCASGVRRAQPPCSQPLRAAACCRPTNQDPRPRAPAASQAPACRPSQPPAPWPPGTHPARCSSVS